MLEVTSISKQATVRWAGVLACIGNLWGGVGVAASPLQSAGVESFATEEMLLAVSINGQRTSDAALVTRVASSEALWIRRDDLVQWRLRIPSAGALSREGDTLYSLQAFPGLSYRIEESQQLLLIDAPAESFTTTTLAGARGRLTHPTPSPPGGFLNYDVFAIRDVARTTTNALAEAGLFNRWGVGVGTFLHRQLPNEQRQVRLETTWTRDRPEEMASLRVGDLVNGAGSWGRAVRFGGLQWATNFASQPGFIAFSRPAMQGEAALPSTLDLYVNDTLRMRRQVPPGPFSIQDMPVMTGQGEARLVVTDILGREQVIVAPYYASPRLLDAGLRAYSYEIGAIREDFGFASNHYGRALATGTFRSGVSPRLTTEVRAEMLEDQQTAGVGSVWLWPAAGVFSAAVAGSRSKERLGPVENGSSDERRGLLFNVGFQGQSRRLGYGLNAQWSSAGFTQVGMERGTLAPRLLAQAYLSLTSGRAGAWSASYTHQDPRDGERIQLMNLTYSVTLGKVGFLSLALLRVLESDSTTVASLSLTRVLGKRDTASFFASKNRDQSRATVRVQRSLPQGEGIGYRLAAGVADTDRREAAISAQGPVGTYGVELAQSDGATRYRGSVSGGVAFLGSDAFLSRRVDSSFAVVKVPGYERVNIYRDNQPIARTDDHGTALISRLRPYEVNSIRIDSADLPLDAKIGSLQLDAIPYLRSGLLLDFPVERSRGATLSILLDSGEALQPGALVTIVGKPEEFAVGLRGEVYVTGLDESTELQASWRQQRCRFRVKFPETTDPLPDLGTFKCAGVVR